VRGRTMTSRRRSLKGGDMANRHRSTRPNRIRVRLWPRRGLSRGEEDALASALDHSRAGQSWTWDGQALAGEMRTPAEFTITDIVDHLCQLHDHPDLVRVEMSYPYACGQSATAWLRVQRSNPDLKVLCSLYGDRLLSAAGGRPGPGWLCGAGRR
jgi:hypothetical protein